MREALKKRFPLRHLQIHFAGIFTKCIKIVAAVFIGSHRSNELTESCEHFAKRLCQLLEALNGLYGEPVARLDADASGGNDKIAGCFLNGMAERIPIRAVIGMTASERTRLVGNRFELPGGKSSAEEVRRNAWELMRLINDREISGRQHAVNLPIRLALERKRTQKQMVIHHDDLAFERFFAGGAHEAVFPMFTPLFA
ncbi:MAG: hypothetical protein ACLT49_03165 [Sutterella wadsworthensis]